MNLTDLPGFKSGSTIRNVAVGIGYLFVIMMVIGAATGPPDDGGSQAAPDGGTTTEAPTTTEQQQEQTSEATEQATTQEETEAEMSDSDRIALLETFLESEGIAVDSVEREGDTIQLAYVSEATNRDELIDEIGTISGSYIGLVESGETAPRMDVTILDAASEPTGTFHVEREWAVAVNNNEMSYNEMALEILQTLEETA